MVNPLDESILTCVKKHLGYEDDYTDYDEDIISCINTTFVDLYERCGIGVPGFLISDKTATWRNFFAEAKYASGITYTWMNVKMMFDPESVVGSVLTSYQEVLKKIEMQLMVSKSTLI